jgi:curli biogenesis system outer membrane secretion channel CsgG
MHPDRRITGSVRAAAGLVLAAALGACAAAGPFGAPAQVDASPGTQALKKLPRKQGERVAVTVYEFRSALPGLNAQAATDMFKTALVQSGQFRVVERSRLNEGVAREKQLQAGGYAIGKAAQSQLRGAQYVFEGTVSEANSAERQSSGGVNVAGMQVGGGSSRDSIAIDVRVVDAASGDIMDAVTVRKTLSSDEANVSGVGNLLATVAARRNKYSPYTPDIQAQQRRSEGVDSAVRAAIGEAVLQIAKRFEP